MKVVAEVYVDEAGEYRWRAETDNGRIVADSAEGYVDRSECVDMATRLLGQANDFEVRDKTHASRKGRRST